MIFWIAENVNANNINNTYLVAAIRLNTLTASAFRAIGNTLATTNDAYIQRFILNPTIAGTVTWVNLPNSGVDYALGAAGNPSANRITGGIILDSNFVSNDTREGTMSADYLFSLGAQLDGTAQVLALCVQPITSNLDVRGKVSFSTL